MFEGQLCSTITCKKCGYQSHTFDNFMDLSVSIPRSSVRITGYVDVADCIKQYTTPESMDKCGYKCSKCKSVDCMSK